MPAQEGDVRPGTKGHMVIAAGRCPGVAGIDMDDLGAFFLGPQDPLEGDGVMLGGIAAHDQDAIAVLQIDIVVRHGTASERLSQSRYRWAVSDPGLVIDVDQAQGPGLDAHEPALLVVHVGAAQMADRFAAVDQLALGVCLDKPLVARVLDQAGDPGKGPVPVLFLPLPLHAERGREPS